MSLSTEQLVKCDICGTVGLGYRARTGVVAVPIRC
jgi:hypothetical protein